MLQYARGDEIGTLGLCTVFHPRPMRSKSLRSPLAVESQSPSLNVAMFFDQNCFVEFPTSIIIILCHSGTEKTSFISVGVGVCALCSRQWGGGDYGVIRIILDPNTRQWGGGGGFEGGDPKMIHVHGSFLDQFADYTLRFVGPETEWCW